MATITKCFTFDDREFPQIKSWLENLPDKRGGSAAIRRAIVFYIENGQKPIQQPEPEQDQNAILDKLAEIESLLKKGAVVVQPGSQPETNEEPEIPSDILQSLMSLK